VTQDTSKQLWGDEADERVRYGKGFHWVESPIVAQYINRNITGDPAMNWVAHSADRYLKGRIRPKILSLGCGGGALERDLSRLLPDAQLQGMDFSAGAIALARERDAQADLRIDYVVSDLNEVNLEPHRYDAVFASGALHHVGALDRLLARVHDSLVPNGALIANEYVGPNQLQWSPAQVEAINEVLAILPDRYLRRISDPADFKRRFLGPSPIEWMNQHDPSEAARSEEIIPLVQSMFEVVELKPFGGTLLHMLLQDIVGNFNPASEANDCILRLICHLEWKLITAGVLTSDFAYFVARPRTS
jgi:SAM-dependent methyltransferase